MTICSCHDHPRGQQSDNTEDSVFVVKIVNDYMYPTFSTVEDIKMYQDNYLMQEEIKVVFASMTPQMIERVGKVAISKSKNGQISILDLVHEYSSGYDIYSRQATVGEKIPEPPSENLSNNEESPDKRLHPTDTTYEVSDDGSITRTIRYKVK